MVLSVHTHCKIPPHLPDFSHSKKEPLHVSMEQCLQVGVNMPVALSKLAGI